MNLINEEMFNGYAVIHQHGPLIEHILLGNEKVLIKAINCHNRLAVMRFELKFPRFYMGDVEVISKFINSLRWRINNDLSNKTANKGRNVKSNIGYIWVKECSANGGWHYHVALILNRDVYNTFGLITSDNANMYNRIFESWASALNFTQQEAAGLVELSPNPVHHLDKRADTFAKDINEVIFRLSYFAKLKTKPYGEGVKRRFYGTSQA